jgi:hypothetical protein
MTDAEIDQLIVDSCHSDPHMSTPGEYCLTIAEVRKILESRVLAERKQEPNYRKELAEAIGLPDVTIDGKPRGFSWSYLIAVARDYARDDAHPTPDDAIKQALDALKAAKQFIENGVEFGYIRMPDADTPDTAHDTLPKINAAIAAMKEQKESGE